MFCKQSVHGTADCLLRLGNARAFRIGTVTHQRQYTFLSDLTKTLQINTVSVYRRIVYLKVSGVYNSSCRRINRQSGGIRNTVVGLDKLYPELPEINGLSVAYYLSLGSSQHIMLF